MSTAALDASDLDRLYEQPSDLITKGVLPRLQPFHLAYLRVASFFCFATGNPTGLDASPRGGAPGFVHALDDKHVAFADWPGNNRISSLRNLTEDDRVGMLFLFPGLEVFMRINGHAKITSEPAVLGRFVENTKTPKTAIVVTVDEVLFHCGKAINRAKLWSEASLIDRSSVPSPGEMKAAMTGQDANIAGTIDGMYYQSVRNNLY